MEGRINRLEQRVDALIDRTSGVEKNLAVVQERLSHMPTKVELWTVAGTVIGSLGAIVLLADRIKAFLG